ncbi:aminotransferase class V-fold PLP-dependent enzyme [Siculibacillus lacustris]|uniref:Aminotransferase class V-fold PLP-dependent enzyme n=1 Tax=Siculibacillus lacustris TaxID=1549641 RepID=A0A4Q9VY43_9HYPH|nr:aminotransferase class V-fold PLP-dependent enzyme [Siculibacillus lacustris]TBW41310.1 aminotransferase class V-fold PLP-dependent enzyme [Siculibacillus lacustris]
MPEDIRNRLGLRPVINVSGTMTSLGASIVGPDAIAAMTGILPQFVEMGDLHRLASRAIAAATGAEAGFVTASCAAGITLAIAATMTGSDLAAIEQLPDTTGLKTEVVMLTGHMVDYGAPIDQSVRLAGAELVLVGQSTSSHAYQLAGAIGENTAAALYVVSHHVAHYGMIPLATFIEVAHAKGVPVIVDGASEYDLRGFLAAGADIAIYSAHKFLGGPTAGLVAGSKALVRATYLQNRGIGRGMKTGKESILGAVAALEAWGRRDHAAVRRRERAALDHWLGVLDGRPGVTATIDPDPTGNPLDRLKLRIDPAEARISAWDLVDALAAGDPPLIVRDHEVEHGFFHLDPCNLHEGEEFLVGDRLAAELDAAQRRNEPLISCFATRVQRQEDGILAWPD